MPLVQVQHVAGAFTRAQQTQLIQEITDAFVRVGGEGIRPNVLLTMTEIQSGFWATGGVPLTIEDIERRRAARQATPA
ncbi:tautomerase family protein [Lichenifustis flavocetrariae]|uniref:Tautomerase family protein n=1 Tax=Lichenifustis flavocetrariae TaxID=2949735 RepID=A0AA42CHR9_9HYPH|nr:tautomerase family protein [Lichenifustis flavocetrariae]MCW6507833.1 tautomerase family protein [Lichenifustis flavocetrariae]